MWAESPFSFLIIFFFNVDHFNLFTEFVTPLLLFFGFSSGYICCRFSLSHIDNSVVLLIS